MTKPRVSVHALVALATLAGPSLIGIGPAYAEGTRAASDAVSRVGSTSGGVAAGGNAASTGSGSVSADQERESIVVSGIGEVSGEPDVLTASFAVETDAPTVAVALDRASAAATKMRDALVRAGIAKADLQTSDVSVNARRTGTKITGYTVNQGLTAKLRNLPKAGAAITSAISAGGDSARLNGTSFAIENNSALLTEARKKAFADARAKAELYAKEAGRPLGRVVRVSEESANLGGMPGLRGMAYADRSVPVEPGRQQLSVTITAEWALGTGA